MGKFVFAAGLAALATLGWSQTEGPVQLTPVVDMSRSTDPSYFATQNGTLQNGPSGQVTVHFTGTHPAWLYQIASEPEDWSGTGMAVMTLTNYQNFPITVGVAISSSTDPSNLSQAFVAPVTLPGGQTTRFGFAYNLPNPLQQGLQLLPPPPGAPTQYVYSQSSFNPSQVGHWRISYQGTAPATIGMSEFDVASYQSGFPNMVDQYFQWTGRDWTNKIYTDLDFGTRLSDELVDLAQNPAIAQLSGSRTLRNMGTSKKWRVARSNGMQYLVLPNGNPFWMFGLNGINDAYGTMVSNREQMFESLPDETANPSLYTYHVADLGPSGEDIYCQRANLMIKYGTNYLSSFTNMLKQRLPSWGFNTVGVGSFAPVTDGSIPFTVLLTTNAYGTRLATPATNWTTLPDPYGADFQSWLNSNFKSQLAQYNSKQNFVGVFVDNEMSWGTISAINPQGTVMCALSALAAGPQQPARVAFINQLKGEYGSIKSLNQAWYTNFSSFNSIAPPASWGAAINFKEAQDCTAFEHAFAATYFSKVRAALTNAGCPALYMGCRFYTYNPPVVSAAAQYSDVLSFNHYGTADTYDWSYFNSLTKPVIFSESSIGLDADGTIGGQPVAYDENTRAQMAYDILTQAAQQPNVVGLNWFNYSDWAVTGDGDSEENFGYGVVDVCDTPHYELIAAFRQFASQLYDLRTWG
jgi:hypothetical protein